MSIAGFPKLCPAEYKCPLNAIFSVPSIVFRQCFIWKIIIRHNLTMLITDCVWNWLILNFAKLYSSIQSYHKPIFHTSISFGFFLINNCFFLINYLWRKPFSARYFSRFKWLYTPPDTRPKKSWCSIFSFFKVQVEKKLITAGKKMFILIDMAKTRKKRVLNLFSCKLLKKIFFPNLFFKETWLDGWSLKVFRKTKTFG